MAEGVSPQAKHVLVVNAGDGRLPRAIQEKLGAGVRWSIVTLQSGLMRHVTDFDGVGTDAWNMGWHEARVAEHGPYDAVILYQLHEFWRGGLYELHRLFALAKPGAAVWVSMVNAQATRMSSRFLPGSRLGFMTLADPTRAAASIDYASVVDFVIRSEGRLTQVWGLLDAEAQEYCQKKVGHTVTWETRGTKIPIGTLADAFLWGASVTAVAFQTKGGGGPAPTPRISFAPYSASLLQALLVPYPDEQSRDAALCAAQWDVAAWRRAPDKKPGRVIEILLEQIGGREQRRRALIVGVGWGRDLLLMKRSVPAWEWVGVEAEPRLLALGADLRAAESATAVSAAIGESLPFADGSFDIAFSFGCFSTLYEPAAQNLASEMRRVTKGTIHHLEDGRGPEHEIQLKHYSLKNVYLGLGSESHLQPVLVDGKPNGLYFCNVASRN